jgi:Pyruvate/2-oxoacid:ferredoxin oxidoreductase delta subunit
MSLTRRGLFSAFLKPLQAKSRSVREAAQSPLIRTDQVAVIQGRHCLAYQQNYCSVCYERCPVPGAIDFNEGMPRIVLEACTGCAVCRDVCPAPENAILLTPRKPGFGA